MSGNEDSGSGRPESYNDWVAVIENNDAGVAAQSIVETVDKTKEAAHGRVIQEIRSAVDEIQADEYGSYDDGKRDGLREALLIVERSLHTDSSHGGEP